MGATAKESDLVQIVLLVFGRHPPSLLTFFGGEVRKANMEMTGKKEVPLSNI